MHVQSRKSKLAVVDNFPEWAVNYCMYGDESNLTDADVEEIRAWLRETGYGELYDVGEGLGFEFWPAFGRGCNVVRAVFERRPGSTKEDADKAQYTSQVYAGLHSALSQNLPNEYVSKVADAIFDQVFYDIWKTTDLRKTGEFSVGDMDLAIGRVLCRKLGIEL